MVAGSYPIHSGCHNWRMCCHECEREECLEMWLFWRTPPVPYRGAGYWASAYPFTREQSSAFSSSCGECRFIRDYHFYYPPTTAHHFRERRCSCTVSHLIRRDLYDIPGRAVGRFPGSLGGWLRGRTLFGSGDRHQYKVQRRV